MIGEHLSHSFSKTIHEDLTGKPYLLREVPPEELDNFMKARDFRGINVTIPFKQAVIPYLDTLSKSAEMTGAVNTIVNRDGKLTGYNTDVDGFRYMLEKADISMSGRKVLILGAGGAARAVSFVARELGASEVMQAVRHPKDDTMFPISRPDLFSDAEVIVNATPVGMSPDIFASPLNLDSFRNLEAVADCIYNPLRTRLLLDAQEMGVKVANGSCMLVEQARRAAVYFHGISFPESETERLVEELNNRKRNIVIYGMPASGKTTLASALSKATGRTWADTDNLVVEKAGMSIPDIFLKEGESGFRSREAEAVRSIAGLQGAIISVGGGTVMSPENVKMLRHNGVLVHLVRDLSLQEAGNGRPLAKDKADLMKLYESRKCVYESLAERTVINNTTIEDALNQFEKLEYR